MKLSPVPQICRPAPFTVNVPLENEALPAKPVVPTSPSDQSDGSAVFTVTVNTTAVKFVKLPDVPVTVTVAVPAVAVLLAVRVSVLEPVAGFGLNDALTPPGRPEADKVTPLLKPFCAPMLMVVVVLDPWVTLTLLGEAESVKFGPALTVSETVAELLKLPDVPVTVTVEVPVAAVLLAVKVSVLDAVAGFGLNDAVTPLGRPVAEKLTPPLKPFCGLIVMVLVPLAP